MGCGVELGYTCWRHFLADENSHETNKHSDHSHTHQNLLHSPSSSRSRVLLLLLLWTKGPPSPEKVTASPWSDEEAKKRGLPKWGVSAEVVRAVALHNDELRKGALRTLGNTVKVMLPNSTSMLVCAFAICVAWCACVSVMAVMVPCDGDSECLW
jgi:hypothetical protein